MTKSKLPYDRLTFDGNFCDIAKCREERWGKYCPDGERHQKCSCCRRNLNMKDNWEAEP